MTGEATNTGRAGDGRFAIDAGCPACGHIGLDGFHRSDAAPANSNLLLADATAAIEFPSGVIELGMCRSCGFITNAAFDASLARYGEGYEESQASSARFLRFAKDLAAGWIERYDLAGKRVLEIGCGKGEFLTLMAEAGIGRGIGIDPGMRPERVTSEAADRLEWIVRNFTADDADLVGDAIVCRHTLEHVHPVEEFLNDIRAAIGDRYDTVLLFELPDTQRILDEVAFWDVYYEHCGYFTRGSLARLFERCGFEVEDLRLEYDGQYLIIEAKPAPADRPLRRWAVDDLSTIAEGVAHFAAGYAAISAEWSGRLAGLAAAGKIAVVWGASSKAVAFLGVVGDHVEAAVDINPHKHGSYLAGTGHRVLAPEELVGVAPDLVIAMNPIYLDEIRAQLDELGVVAELIGL